VMKCCQRFANEIGEPNANNRSDNASQF
jgi:hypothetical protein